MRSMTGYGRGQSSREGVAIIAEVKTVNHRYLDVSVRLPRSLSALEITLRKRLAERYSRGHIELSINQDQISAQTTLVSANFPLAHEYAQAAQHLAAAAGIKGTMKLSTLLALPEVLHLVPLELEAETLLDAAVEAMEAACGAVDADREREGEELRQFFITRLDGMESALGELTQAAHEQPLQAYEKLLKRLSGMQDIAADPQRLAQEAALLADRCDVTEEISRLSSHCAQMRTLAIGLGPLGRDMDFLAQEMNREANTICSKSASLEVTRLGLKCKSEADKIREQIQNVE
jgi:uncharacterized protein (TIGR00255 family)